jgi:tetrahydromethanopterin S-methyltransferase subunit G
MAFVETKEFKMCRKRLSRAEMERRVEDSKIRSYRGRMSGDTLNKVFGILMGVIAATLVLGVVAVRLSGR